MENKTMNKEAIDTMAKGPELYYELLETVSDVTGVKTFRNLMSMTQMELISSLFTSLQFTKILAGQLSLVTDLEDNDILSSVYFQTSLLATSTQVAMFDEDEEQES